MATPPAEAPSLVKEEKPQLPPSPNGVSSTEIVTGYVLFIPLDSFRVVTHS